MRKDLKAIALMSLITVLLLTAGLGKIENRISQVKSYPATVCPGTNVDGSNVDLLPNAKIIGTSIPSNKNKMTKIGTSNFASKKALLIDGSSVTSTSVLKGNSGWMAAVNCSISDGDDWFIGGTGSVSSKGTISVVNSGLSSAQVDFKIYSSKAPRIVSKTIPANSVAYVLLDSLAPGEESIVVNAITRAGRVSIFMLDNRNRGLRAIGADYVAPAGKPSKTVVIPNIPIFKSDATQLVRIVVPGSVDANIKANIFSSDGSFSPSVIDGANINGESVKDFVFKPIVQDSSYALRIDSDVPISASVLTVLPGDLIWSTATPVIDQTALQVGGFKPLIRIYGKNINVDLDWIDTNGNRGNKRLVGTDTIAFRPKVGLSRVTFKATGSDSYGSLLLSSGSGYAILPILSGSHLESSSLPKSDARAINRG